MSHADAQNERLVPSFGPENLTAPLPVLAQDEPPAASPAQVPDGENPGARTLGADGAALLDQGRLGAAIHLLRQALRQDPANPDFALNLATALFRAGLLPEALAQACAAVELFRIAGRRIAPARHLQGLIHLEAGRIDRARQVLASALESDPTFVPAVLALAQCSLAHGDLRGAGRHVRAARRLLDRAPENVRASYADAIDACAAEIDRAGRWWHPRALAPDDHAPETPRNPLVRLYRWCAARLGIRPARTQEGKNA